MKYLVEATNKYEIGNVSDNELSVIKGVRRYIPKEGERWEVENDRKELLVENGFVKIIEEIKEESKAEEKKTSNKKATKKVKE